MPLEMAPTEILEAVRAQNGREPNTMIARFYRRGMVDEKRTNGWVEQKFDPNTGMPGPLIRHPGEGGILHRNAICVEIRAPGDKDFIVQREMRELDKYRFEKEWKLFEESEKGAVGLDGTPLDAVPFLDVARIADLQASGVKTVEQLAAISDANGQKFMDFHRMRQAAKDFLAAAKGAAPLQEMRAELESRDAQIAALQKQIKEIAEAQAKKKG